jgi:hypothetical protein
MDAVDPEVNVAFAERSRLLHCADLAATACTRARAFRFSSLAFGVNMPDRERTCVAAKSSQAGTFSLNFDLSNTIFPLGNSETWCAYHEQRRERGGPQGFGESIGLRLADS